MINQENDIQSQEVLCNENGRQQDIPGEIVKWEMRYLTRFGNNNVRQSITRKAHTLEY